MLSCVSSVVEVYVSRYQLLSLLRILPICKSDKLYSQAKIKNTHALTCVWLLLSLVNSFKASVEALAPENRPHENATDNKMTSYKASVN